MWQSKVLDGLQGFIESFSLTNSQHLIFQKAVKKTLPLKDLSLLPPKLAEFFMSSEPIRIVSDVTEDSGFGFSAHKVSIVRSLNSNVPHKIPARKISLEQPLEKVAEKLNKLKTTKRNTVKKTNKATLKVPEGKLLRIDSLKTRQIIFERSTPRIFYPGQAFGFQREYHEYLVRPDIYPDHVPMPKALHDMLLKNMTLQGKAQFEEYDFRLFRSRILADADEFCGGICVDEKKEILFAEDFMQWLEFGEERGGEKGEGIKTAYILDVLSHSTNPEISKAANKLLEKTDSKTLGELYKLTQRYKEAEKKYHNNKKPLRIKPITHVATTAAIEENMLKILGAITQAKDEGYHLAYFPELITSSYQLEGVIASPDFLERHDQELFEINRYVRFMFAKEAHQFLNQISNDGRNYTRCLS
jgi:hypothetical protein